MLTIFRPLSTLLGMISRSVSRPASTTCRRVMSLTMPAVPSLSSMRSPMSKGLVALSISPQMMSDMTGCAAKPAMAPMMAVPWKSTLPKDWVSGELITTHSTANRMITKRTTLSTNRRLMFFFRSSSFSTVLRSSLSTRNTPTHAATVVISSLMACQM